MIDAKFVEAIRDLAERGMKTSESKVVATRRCWSLAARSWLLSTTTNHRRDTGR